MCALHKKLSLASILSQQFVHPAPCCKFRRIDNVLKNKKKWFFS